MEFVDRILKCSDCGNDFVFTAGEQLFFFDKQFKNDPKRCKMCKAKRAGMGRSAADGVPRLPLSRTETRTECSACGQETTVPFKPTQGRPVLCRSCFQLKRVPSAVAAVTNMESPAEQIAAASDALEAAVAAHEFDSMTSSVGAGANVVAGVPPALLAESSEASEGASLAAEVSQA